jgi:ParB-like chromosome segregation protein Spo0J
MTTVPLSHIVDHEEVKYRALNKDHVDALAKNIAENGLDTPITVWNGGSSKGEQITVEGSDKKIPATFLIAGLHRRAAIRKIKKDTPERYKELFPNGVPVVVKSGEMADFLSLQLRENVLREEMEVSQILPIIKRLKKEFGLKQREIAKRIGKGESYVSQILDAEETLGESETEDLAEEGATLTDVRNAAKKVKEAVKKGKDKEKAKKEVVAATKSKVQQKKATGRQRDERKVSAKALWNRFLSLPRGVKMGRKLEISVGALGYLAGDEEFATLPKELREDVETKKSKDDDGDDE